MGLVTPRRYGDCRVPNEPGDLAACEVWLTIACSGQRCVQSAESLRLDRLDKVIFLLT